MAGSAKRVRGRYAWAVLPVLAVAALLTTSAPAEATTARMGYYWTNGTLAYGTRVSYRYDVIVHPEGGFAEEGPQSFAYITAQNKHVVWDSTPYGVEVVIAYFSGNHGAKEFWLAWLDDESRYHDVFVSGDADQPDGFLGPHWDLATLREGGYIFGARDGTAQRRRYLRVRAQTRLISADADSSTWENRVDLFDIDEQRWELKGSNRFTLPASPQQVRASTARTGGGIWAGILETYGDDEGAGDPRPPLKPFGYRNRSVRIGDRGEVRRPRLDESTNSWRDDGVYDVLYRSPFEDVEWVGAGPGAAARP